MTFFYRYKILHKNYGIRQFLSSIIKSDFGLGSQNPWTKSKFLIPYSKLAWVRFETGIDQIRNWLTGFDFWHGPKNKTLCIRYSIIKF
jgi:hypothetical protein